MSWHTIQVMFYTVVLLSIIYDFVNVFFNKQPLGKFNSLWYMLVVAYFYVNMIINAT